MKNFFIFMLLIISFGMLTGCSQQTNGVTKTLKVGTDANFPPFEYFQKETNSYTGFDVELITALGKNMGYDKVEFVNADFDELLKGLNERKYDVVIACMTVTEERKKAASFSDIYASGGYSVLAPVNFMDKNNNDILKNKKIAVEKGSITKDIAEKYTNTIIECNSSEEALQKLADKTVDFFIVDKYVGAFFVANGYSKTAKILETLNVTGTSGMGIAVRKTDSELLAKINTSLKEYKQTSSYEQLKTSYFGSIN